MSKFDLGLEALADQQGLEMTGDILSYEYLDTVMQFNDEAAEAVVIADGIGAIASAMENLGAICDVLKEHGNSPALEALVGGNFREGFSLEAAEKAKEGLWARFVKWLKTLWAKIKAFFAKYFVSAEKMSRALKERARELQDNDMKEVTVSIPSNEVIKAAASFIQTTFKDELKQVADEIKQLKSGKVGDSAIEKVMAKRTGDYLQTGLNAFMNPESINITKQAAIVSLNLTADCLDALKVCQAAVDGITTVVENLSFSADNETAEAVGKDVKEAAGGKGKQAAAAGKLAEEGVKAFGSDGFREALMKGNRNVTSFLSSMSRKLVAYGSMQLSTFKVAKTSK